MDYIKIAIDGFGGDNAPEEVVKGVKSALDQIKDLKIVITGKQQVISELLIKCGVDKDRCEIIDAQDVITNDDVPTVAIRTKKESSLVKAFDIAKQDDVKAVISAGSTGAVLTGGFLKIGRINGISRPALAPTLPTAKGTPVLLIDCGANMDSKPINLVHFALMGNKYMQSMYGVQNPRVALLNVGTEDHKGNELVKKVFPILKELPINFVGNMEARELLSGDYDVVVTDGFAGNVLLKSTEGAVKTILGILKTDIKSHTASKIGAMFMKGTFGRLKSKFDYSIYGGSPFLGVKKVLVKCHGDSKAESFCQAIKQAHLLSQSNMVEQIAQSVENLDIKIEE